MEGFAAALGDGRLAVFLPAALLLGALHALEPGHAKTMIASFIIATRGSPARALVLGVAAAISHSLVVWALVLATMWLGLTAVPEAWQPWLGVAAGIFALLLAGWMGWRQWHGGHHHHDDHHHGHGHDHHHPHHHHHEHHHHDHDHDHDHDHAPHDHAPHDHAAHGHHHAPPPITDPGWLGTIGFGISGGLMPCPAALTVLLLCLQAGAAAAGAMMVAAFSIGLAMVLVGVGVVASVASGIAMRRSGFLSSLGERAPWLSVAIIAASGLYTLVHALLRLS